MVEELRAVAPRPRSARWLAARFEVSARTIERDVAALQQAGTPVYAEPGRSGGYVLDRTHSLPPLNVSPAEAAAVAVGLRMLEGTPFAVAARSALQKVVAAMRAPDVAATARLADRIRVIVPDELTGVVPAAVRTALERREVLRLAYVDREGAASDRLVEPLGFLGGRRHWYLIAWCRTRTAVRDFRLDRIGRAELTGERAPAREPDLDTLDALGHELVALELPRM